jgi:hypothetical protein
VHDACLSHARGLQLLTTPSPPLPSLNSSSPAHNLLYSLNADADADAVMRTTWPPPFPALVAGWRFLKHLGRMVHTVTRARSTFVGHLAQRPVAGRVDPDDEIVIVSALRTPIGRAKR